MIVKTPDGITFRAGVLGVVRGAGEVAPNNPITIELSAAPTALPAI
jgi:hypothetical protein